MFIGPSAQLVIWIIAALAILGVIMRPKAWPEAVWAATGAALLVLTGLLPLSSAWHAVLKGTDVYLFLIGMMLMSEVARREGLFDWLAGLAVQAARGSAVRLFALIYIVGAVITIFLSNDACTVVLTSAVYAATKAAKIGNPLPYLLICAFVANAASFVLPISNPANLVVYAAHMPTLLEWLAIFSLPSLLAILTTGGLLYFTQRRTLHQQHLVPAIARPVLSRTGLIAALGLLATSGILIITSAVGWPLGAATFIAGLATVGLVLGMRNGGLTPLLTGISWSILPLVAGLFILIEALSTTTLLTVLSDQIGHATLDAPHSTAWASGVLVAIVSNLANNLPAGLFAGSLIHTSGVSADTAGAILIGVDLGPNLSVTGSLATILWLTAIRREGHTITGWQFFKLGLVIMPPALLLALAALLWV